MKLSIRLCHIRELFNQLEKEPSRIAKESLIASYKAKDAQLAQDIIYALEILDGRHKLGYTYYQVPVKEQKEILDNEQSLERYLQPLFEPLRTSNFSWSKVYKSCAECSHWGSIIGRLVNREYRLGIGKSQLEKDRLAVMLAKTYTPNGLKKDYLGYYLTEKLDGNRCVASFEGQWQFYSRSRKPLKVCFDMSGLDTSVIYDGEIVNKNSKEFQEVSGAVNSKYGDKSQLVYRIFDIIDTTKSYAERREFLDTKVPQTSNVMVLPLIEKFSTFQEVDARLPEILDSIVSAGGEGVMINLGSACYQQKRTDALIKVKQVRSADMLVMALEEGHGSNEGLVVALTCQAYHKGNWYRCKVGSGLSRQQREHWAVIPEEIVGKIVEVRYFSVSQDSKSLGTNEYSLRFPRLYRIRNDKHTTSMY